MLNADASSSSIKPLSYASTRASTSSLVNRVCNCFRRLDLAADRPRRADDTVKRALDRALDPRGGDLIPEAVAPKWAPWEAYCLIAGGRRMHRRLLGTFALATFVVFAVFAA